MIVEISPKLFVADLESGHPEGSGAAIIHACKAPCHKRAIGYDGTLPQDHPNYLFREDPMDLWLNIIDPNVPLFREEVFAKSLEFIRKNIKDRPVIIHCNQGISRAPSIAMLYLFNAFSYEEAVTEFKKVYPQYTPGEGIQTFLSQNWDKFSTKEGKLLKLHLGCGDIKMDGYINIDLGTRKEGVVDREYDLNQPLDYPDNSVEIIQSFHMFEHLRFANIEQVIKSWYRVMAPGGKIIMEMPDFDETLKYVLANPNDNAAIACIYGSQEHSGQYHHWGWNKSRLKLLLEGVGFKNVTFPEPQDYHTGLEPCLRVEANK